MTEKQKMLAGQAYRSRDPELLAIYHRAKQLQAEFAATTSVEGDRREQLLRSLFGTLGAGVWIEPPFFCDYGEQIHIGANCFINYNCVFLDSNRIDIGNNVLIGPAVQIYTASHPLSAKERLVNDGGYLTLSKPVRVEDNCWLGGGVLLMPGVTIGANSTIGAGSVVTRDIPANRFAAGNPCRVIREI